MKRAMLMIFFGVRWQAKRDTALDIDDVAHQRTLGNIIQSAIVASLCHRTPCESHFSSAFDFLPYFFSSSLLISTFAPSGSEKLPSITTVSPPCKPEAISILSLVRTPTVTLVS